MVDFIETSCCELQDFFAQPSMFGMATQQDLSFSMGGTQLGAPHFPQVSLLQIQVIDALVTFLSQVMRLLVYDVCFCWL